MSGLSLDGLLWNLDRNGRNSELIPDAILATSNSEGQNIAEGGGGGDVGGGGDGGDGLS